MQTGYAAGINAMDSPRCASGIQSGTDCLGKCIEENQMLVARLRERLGSVCRPPAPMAGAMSGNGLKMPEQSPVAESLAQLANRVADNNREMEALLDLIDL